MFSFFKKKQSPSTPPSEVGTADPGSQPPNGDEFIFIERRKDSPQPAPGSIYPPLNPGPYQPGAQPISTHGTPIESVHPLQGVPFKLSPQLVGSGDTTEVTRLQCDEILSHIAHTSNLEYGFELERSVIAIQP